MMRLPRLEVFAPEAESDDGRQMLTLERAAFEEEKLVAYEQGFQAGWDDSVAAQTDEVARLRTDLGHNLQSLSFTYQEARAHVLAGLESLIEEMVHCLLPELARETLAPMVLERVVPMAEKLADQPVELILNPVARKPVENMLDLATGLPLRIVEEKCLAEGQVYFRLGTTEAKIDLTRVVAEISAATHAFFAQISQEPEPHGESD